MAAIKNSEEAFNLFREKFGLDADGDMHAVGLFAYSLVEKDRIDWMEHFRRTHSSEPTEHQIAEWYSAKPESYFDQVSRFGLHTTGHPVCSIRHIRFFVYRLDQKANWLSLTYRCILAEPSPKSGTKCLWLHSRKW